MRLEKFLDEMCGAKHSKKKKKKVDEVASEEDVMKTFKDKAKKSMGDLSKNAIAGYGKGNAIKHIVDVLKASIPKDLHGFIQNKSNWKT